MFHHLRRLWRPEGRSKPLPSRHCCGNDSSGPPSFGGVPRGPVLRLRRKTTRLHLVPALACVSCRYPNQSRSHPSLRWDRLTRVVLRLSARRAGRCPPQEKKKHSASLRLFFFFSCGSPQQVATCTGAALPAPHQLGPYGPALVGPLAPYSARRCWPRASSSLRCNSSSLSWRALANS